MTRSVSPRLTGAVALAAVAALAVTACGGDDTKEAATSAPAQPASLAITVQTLGKKGATYELPGTVAGGVVTITVDNETKFPREAQLIRVDGNHSAAEVRREIEAEGKPIPDWLHAAGGADAKPNTSRKVTLDLVPGTYFITDTGDPDFEGTPARMKRFTVTAGASQAKLPAASAQITASDYDFTATGLKAGANAVRFRNTGKEVHHAIMFRMNEGAKIGDVEKFFKTEGESGGPPPVDFEHGVTSIMALDGGSEQVVDVDLKAGRYAAVCFVTDRDGGPPHFIQGQLAELTVGS